MALLDHHAHPVRSLTLVFTAWKAFLLAVALGASVGPDYDTSTSLFFERLYGGSAAAVPVLAQKLTRWDAIYFIHAARVGKIYEQEWAFGTGLSGLISGLLRWNPVQSHDMLEPLMGIAIAHASHLLSVIALYKLTVLISRDTRLSFVASALHVISPAGLFLSAPYAESPFSCLSFLGIWLFALSYTDELSSFQHHLSLVAAGALFGLSTVFRSNGLANGLLFAVEAVRCLGSFLHDPSLGPLISMVAPVLGGLLVAAGTIIPQAVAWMRYCQLGFEAPERPWCSQTLPSIYSFVQEHYWDVGFLRYWTLNQLPLFLLAAPALALLITSALQVLHDPSSTLRMLAPNADKQARLLARTLAAAQAFVALLAITTYHVQVINRLSSGYVIWYWWIASRLLDEKSRIVGYAVTIFFVMYSGIQGSLFASFLPPA